MVLSFWPFEGNLVCRLRTCMCCGYTIECWQLVRCHGDVGEMALSTGVQRCPGQFYSRCMYISVLML